MSIVLFFYIHHILIKALSKDAMDAMDAMDGVLAVANHIISVMNMFIE